MSRIKIAQLASFRGNVGDQANVLGTRRLLARALGEHVSYTNIEYLEYEPDPTWGGRRFDEAFIRLVNEHDLLLIGGGGFFELAVDKSVTGTPIDISLEMLDRIRPPVVFHGLGFDISAGVTPIRVERFTRFLEHCLNRPSTLVSVRNDGSLANLRRTIGPELADRVNVIPDGGFFLQTTPTHHPELPPNTRCIAVNLAGDALGFRYGDTTGNQNNFENFLKQFASVLNRLIAEHPDIHLIMMPHIPEDLNVIWRLVQRIGPPNMRKHVSVAPYLLGCEGADYIFDAYRQCELSIGMRFHANVCPIGLGVPTIGLVSHPQVAALYHELGMTQRTVNARAADFADRLETLIHETLDCKSSIQAKYAGLCRTLETQMEAFHRKVAAMSGHDGAAPANRALSQFARAF